MVSAEVEGLDGLWGGYLGFDLKFAIEVNAGGVTVADEGGVVPSPARGNGFAGAGFLAATIDELALGVEAE